MVNNKEYEHLPYLRFGEWAAIQRIFIRLELPANETKTEPCCQIRHGVGVIFSTKCGNREMRQVVYFSDWVNLRKKKKDETWYEGFVTDWNTVGVQIKRGEQ